MVAGDDEEPVAEIVDGREAGAFVPDAEEDLLHGIFGGLGMFEISDGQGIYGVPVGLQ